MKVGLIYPQIELGGDPEGVRRIGLATEEMGFDHLLVYDHVLGATHDREPKLAGPYTERDPFHDPFVMLSYVAAITSRIELVTGVIILPQRQTVLVARQAADVDLLSGERLRLGIGTGWNYVEYDALGEDFETRGPRYSEQIELLRKLWGEELVAFDGKFDQVDRAALIPRPKRQIPLWMGGYSNIALRRAARVGDGFMFADGLGDSFRKLEKLKEMLAEEGRDAASFGLQCNMLSAKGAEAVVERSLRWRDAGGSHVGVNTMGMGFSTIDEHIGYVEEVREALGKAGVM
ncbi:MAG: LLM class F420-dependent oxidoreductase [Novosphingobium sp.]|nr:LLM class F420-dependent oxidoreductase [Novosphingobium sp.]